MLHPRFSHHRCVVERAIGREELVSVCFRSDLRKAAPTIGKRIADRRRNDQPRTRSEPEFVCDKSMKIYAYVCE
jgi:hypothetical protein